MFHMTLKNPVRVFVTGLGLVLFVATMITGTPALAQTSRYVDPAGTCAGNIPCYTTINAAVAASVSGDTIYVFPGAYTAGVDLGTMSTSGDITLVTVNAAGAPTPGTATINPPSGCAIYNYSSTVTGQV